MVGEKEGFHSTAANGVVIRQYHSSDARLSSGARHGGRAWFDGWPFRGKWARCCRVLVKQVAIGRKPNLYEGSRSGTCSSLCVLQAGDTTRQTRAFPPLNHLGQRRGRCGWRVRSLAVVCAATQRNELHPRRMLCLTSASVVLHMLLVSEDA